MNNKGEKYYVYIIGPIDYFDNSMDIKQYAHKELDNYFSNDDYCTVGNNFLTFFGDPNIETIINKYEKAKLDIKNVSEQRGLSWEMTFRRDPIMFSIPCEGKFEVGFVIKQDNNGITYVASPVPLPHLKDIDWVESIFQC